MRLCRLLSEVATRSTAQPVSAPVWLCAGERAASVRDDDAAELVLANARWHTLPEPPVEKNWRPRSPPKSTIQPQPPGASLLRTSTPVRPTYLRKNAMFANWDAIPT